MAKATTKPPTKTEVFTSIADATGLSKRDVSAVFDALNEQIHKALSGRGGSRTLHDPRPLQDRRAAQAGHEGTPGHQSVHRRADHVQGQAGPQRRQSPAAEEAQGYGVVIGRTQLTV